VITITGVGPTRDSCAFASKTPNHQPSGRITALARGANGTRMYAGSFAGVWRSDDAGRSWFQLARPQPGLGVVQAEVPGALLAPHVFDLVASPSDPDVALVSAVDSQFIASKDGIWRTADGGASWTLVLPTTAVCNVAFAPDNGKLAYAALGYTVATSQDAGATWTIPPFAGVYATHIAVAHREADGTRRVYACAYSRLWCSTDGGATWVQDASTGITDARQVVSDFQSACLGGSGGMGGFGFPIAYAGGTAGQTLAIEPGNPAIVYLGAEGGANGPSFFTQGVMDGTLCNTTCARLAGEASLWRGDFSQFGSTGAAQWTQLPGPPIAADTTPSGNTFVVTQGTSNGFLVFFSDNSHVHVATGVPTAANSWHRLDGRDIATAHVQGGKLFMHVDPHGLVVSPDFDITLEAATGVDPPYDQSALLQQFITGTIWMANDGGVHWSDDGGQSWNRQIGLETVDPVNIGGLFGAATPALYFGCGDNDEFFSLDGGATWGDPGEGCGDCDCWFADVARMNQAMHFLPRRQNSFGFVSIITNPDPAKYPDPSVGTQKIYVPSTRKLVPGDPTATPPVAPKLVPYASSGLVLRGLRPLIRTLATELPPPDGDYVFIHQTLNGKSNVVRTMAISSIATVDDWTDPAKATLIGPQLPMNVDVVQAAGGQITTAFYVGDAAGTVYKLRADESAWDKIFTGALRWFVDPFDPDTVYALDYGGVKVSVDGGESFQSDFWLTHVATAGGKLSIGKSLLQDMLFMRGERMTRFAFGTAGVFWSADFGVQWYTLLNSFALPGRPESGFFDPITDPTDRALYVECEGRGILRIGGVPELPPFEPPPPPPDLMEFAAILVDA
jgi:hypothetical protein